jgi:alpha-mannosidase
VIERVLQMVGNAHIDPVWLWQWPEGLAEVRATFRSALDRMTEYPDFIFTAGSAAYYEWVERADRAMFEEIRRRVEEGRWELVGGWWVEPDCNLPGGESFVRQALLGQRYFASRFGRTATTGYNPDSFGHAATLPQILGRAGLEQYVFMRPQPHELELPAEVFWWEGPDGSRVLAARIPHEYCGPRGALHEYVETALTKLPVGWQESLLFYGVGNHGGGPTRENIDSLLDLDARAEAEGLGTLRPRLRLSSPDRFFARIRAALEAGELELPVWRGELQHHARGCYAAHSGVKRWDRSAEAALLTAEALTALDPGRDSGEAPASGFEQAWRNVAFNQFHDILAGTAIQPAYDDARDTYGESMAIAGRATHLAVQRIARRIDLPVDPQTRPIVVLNPHAWTVTATVELEVGGLKDDDVLLDDQDRSVPWQRVQSLATASEWRRRLAFRAELPPLGYRVYRTVSVARAPELMQAQAAARAPIEASDLVLDNGRLRLEVDPDTGWIRSLRDLATSVQLAGEGLARAIVLDDPSDTWSHDLVAYDRAVGPFLPVSVRLVESGPVRATIRVDGRFRESRLVLDVSLDAGADRVELRARLDWRERRRLLKLRFGTSIEPETVAATSGVAFGAVSRPAVGTEEPGGPWAVIAGRVPAGEASVGGGLLVMTDSKSGHDAIGPDLGVTIVRSPIYAHHDPRVAEEAAEEFAYQDLGLQELRMALVPFAGTWTAAVPARLAAQRATPAITLLESFHAGPLPRAASFGKVSGEGVTVTALKRAEDGDGTVVRLAETTGMARSAAFRLGDRRIAVELEPWSVRTFLLPDDPAGGPAAVEVDLLERPLELEPEQQR